MAEFESVDQVYDALMAGDAGETPTVPAETTTESAGPTAETPSAEGGETPFRWETVPPELEPLAKGFQADYTREMQRVAEQRKAIEAEKNQVAGWLAFQRLTQEDPAQAAMVLQQYAAMMGGGGQVGPEAPETDPYAELEPQTELEAALLREMQQVKQQLAEWQAFRDRQAAAETEAKARAAWEEMNAEYGQIEQQIGRALTEAEKDEIAGHCVARGIKSVLAGYRDLRWDAEIERARQEGRNQASTVVQQKAGAPGAPSTLVQRTPTGPPEYANEREMISSLYDQMVAAG